MKTAMVLCLLAACSSEAPLAVAPPRLTDVVYVGATTDEALTRMLASTAKETATQRLLIDSPASTASLPANAPIAFSFQPGAATLRVPARSRLRTFLAWLSPLGVAHAHGAPFNGVGYYLVVSDATEQQKLRVFTDRRFCAVEAAGASALQAAKQPLALTITSAVFEQNEVTENGGPFLAGSVDFRVE